MLKKLLRFALAPLLALASLVLASGGQLLLINPRKRRRGRRKMSALQMKYFGGGRKRRSRRRSAVRRRRNPLNIGGYRVRRRRFASRPMRRYRRRRNPIGLGSIRSTFSGGIMGVVKNAATGAAGAIAVDVIMGQAQRFLPPSLQTPNAYPFVKAAAAVGFGLLGRRMIGPVAVKMAEGSLICTARDFMRSFVPAALPLGGMGYSSPAFIPPVPGQQNLSRYLTDASDSGSIDEMSGLGMYVNR